jgi:hypothetical protein
MFLTILLTVYFFTISGISTGDLLLNEKPTNNFQSEQFYAKIEVNTAEEYIDILGMFYNHSADTLFLEYKMETEKFSNSGSSISNQSGKFRSEPESKTVISKVGLNIDTNVSYRILLKVFQGDSLISSDSLNFISNQ